MHRQTNPTTLWTPREHIKHGSRTGSLHGTNRIQYLGDKTNTSE